MSDYTLEELLLQNPNAPTNDEFALAFARRLYQPFEERVEERMHFDFAEGPADFSVADDDDEGFDWCGEQTIGLLEAALASDLVSADARGAIEAMAIDAAPALEMSKTIGHFRFRWTEESPDSRDNTTEANIDATGVILNDCWDRYVADFRQPQASLIGGVRRIDVDVYYNGGLHGSTSSHSNRIFLNARTVVNDPCRRQTTSAHELFHRVEYTYGYVTGTPDQKWWVEALGSWSQEYYAPDVDDYIGRVNSGLADPAKPLLTRSYDACHYWKYLGEQVAARSDVDSEHEAIAEVLDAYAGNGFDAKAASGRITQDRLSRSFDRFFQDWSKANYLKDLDRPSAKYDYLEDETETVSCGRRYGPYRHVAPTTDVDIATNTTNWDSGSRTVAAYGTRYHHFDIADGVTEFELRFEGNTDGRGGRFSVHIALLAGNRWRRIFNSSSTTETTRHIEMTAGQYDRCVVVVNGLDVGGTYELGLNSCLTGTWRDGFGFVWTLQQAGDDVTGTVATTGCGTYDVTGSIDGDQLVLEATGNCCDFTYRGTVDDCASAEGDWTNTCDGSGSFSMNKIDPADADAIDEDDPEEHADDPTSMGAE